MSLRYYCLEGHWHRAILYARLIGVLSEPPKQVSFEEFKKLKDPEAG